MKKIYSGEYYGAAGSATEAAGIGLSLGREKVPVTLAGSGVVVGGSGYTYPSNSKGFAAGGEGGTGLAITTGILTNDGGIYGGFGGAAISNGTGNAGAGGAAVSFAGQGVLINHGFIDGGLGGVGGSKVHGGAGGVGLAIGGGLVVNDSQIYGGNGGGSQAGGIEGNGADAIVLDGNGIVLNSGTIFGGSGLVGGVGIAAGDGGAVINFGYISGGGDVGMRGGAGVSLGMNSQLLNFGTIKGGNEFNPGLGIDNTSGGIGAILYGGALPDINEGLIVGGSAQPNMFGLDAYGATGVLLQNAGTLINDGMIVGGAGAGHEGAYFAPAVELAGGGTVINAGTIFSAQLGVGPTAIAIAFGDAGSSRLIIDPGSQIGGLIAAGGSGNVIELASGNFGLLWNLDNELDSPYGDFQTLQMDSGSAGTITSLTTNYAFHPMVQLQYDSDWGLSGSVVDLVNAGTVNIESGTSLDIASVDPSSSGIFVLTGQSSLEIGQLLGSNAQIDFMGSDNLLTIDTPSAFGLNLGGTHFAGPELEDFQMGDKIDLKGIGNTGLKTIYDSETGVLQISSSSGGVIASLQFATASLGAGGFHLASDGAGGSILKLS